MKLRKILEKILLFCLYGIVCFTAFKVLIVIIATPILTFYGVAADFYLIANDASYFELARQATQLWLKSLTTLCLGLLIIKFIKIKKGLKSKDD